MKFSQPMTSNERPVRVMIVDDEIDLLPLFEHFATVTDVLWIESRGIKVLDKLDRINYDIDAVILDLSMPDRDGLTVTADIRAQENLRSKVNPILIFWYTGTEVEGDPTLMAAKEDLNVKGVFIKGRVEPLEVFNRVKAIIRGSV